MTDVGAIIWGAWQVQVGPPINHKSAVYQMASDSLSISETTSLQDADGAASLEPGSRLAVRGLCSCFHKLGALLCMSS